MSYYQDILIILVLGIIFYLDYKVIDVITSVDHLDKTKEK
jgi:hypothetical protein